MLRRDTPERQVKRLNIILNGEPARFPEGTTVARLLAAQGEPADHVLVEVNGRFVAPGLHADHVLADGDRVEVILPAFGG